MLEVRRSRRRAAPAAGFALALVCAATLARLGVAAEGELQSLTFADALARARAHNPNALIAAAEVRRAEALLMQVRAGALPSIVPQGTYTRIDDNRTFMGVTIQSEVQKTADGGIAVPLVVPQRWAAWAHASDNRRVSVLSLDEVRRQVAIAVAHAYLAVIAQHRLVQALANARDDARAHADYAHKQDQAGAVSHLDAVRAGQQWHTTEVQLEDGRVALLSSQEALGVLVADNHPIDAAETPTFPLPAAGGPAPGPQPNAPPPDARRPGDETAAPRIEVSRADLIAQAMRVSAADHQVRDSWTDFMPYLLGKFDPLYNEPPTIFQPRFSWQAQLQVVFPLFEGGLRVGQARERRALLDEASVGLEADVRQARSDIRFGFEAADRAEARLLEATQAAALARDALGMANLRYREGAANELDVIDAQRQARDTDISAAAAEDNLRQVHLDLLAATGRFP